MVYSWLILTLLPLPLPIACGLANTFGVAPALLSRYTQQNSDVWQCLDGSKQIAWSSINDDYCDCLDGSDEPGKLMNGFDVLDSLNLLQGTSACANGTFYCLNQGHIGASIPSSRVNDGLCGVSVHAIPGTVVNS
jgi:protein kinase C substrate 80K-H